MPPYTERSGRFSIMTSMQDHPAFNVSPLKPVQPRTDVSRERPPLLTELASTAGRGMEVAEATTKCPRSILKGSCRRDAKTAKDKCGRLRFHRWLMMWAAAEEQRLDDLKSLLEDSVAVSLRNNDRRSGSVKPTNVYLRTLDYNDSDKDGLTILHLCCFLGSKAIESIRLLLELGANPNLLDKEGWTALHVAAACRHAELVPVMLEAGARVPLVSEGMNVGVRSVTDDGHILRLIKEHWSVRVASTSSNTSDVRRLSPPLIIVSHDESLTSS